MTPAELDLDHLVRMVQERDRADARIRAQIGHLRQLEVPWSTIGSVLGVSKQAAQAKYGRSRVSLSDRPLEL